MENLNEIQKLAVYLYVPIFIGIIFIVIYGLLNDWIVWNGTKGINKKTRIIKRIYFTGKEVFVIQIPKLLSKGWKDAYLGHGNEFESLESANREILIHFNTHPKDELINEHTI